MGQLAERFDDLAPALRRARARLVDLLSLVRHHVYHPRFAGSFSIKSVAPGLVAGFGYGDLDEVADGGGAQAAFARLGEAGLEPAEAARLRRALLAYCRRDTLALVEVHRVLRRLAAEAA
jgi:predicted RecB family nuclease